VQREVVTAASATIVYEKSIYGTDPTKNQNGRLVTQYDRSGRITHDLYDFKGNLLSSTRTFTSDYKDDIDWSNPAAVALNPMTYTTEATFDALDRVVTSSTPDTSVETMGYNESGLLNGVNVVIRGSASQPFISRIVHDEKLRRQRVEYGNGTITTFAYDPLTFRVRRIFTVRAADNASLQDLNYTYDPIGNVTQIRDAAQQTVFFNNQVVAPQKDFIYDAIYRLISATGREHVGQNAPVSEFDEFRTNLAHPADGGAMQRYLQQYDYDACGNLLNMVHSSGSGPFTNQWTRQFTLAPSSNQLSSSKVGASVENYSYDVHGNLTSMPGMATLNWDFNNEFRSVDLGGGGTAYYTYDAAGYRARKVIERQGGIIEQRLYLGTLEFYTRAQTAIQLERQTLHVMDGPSRLAMIDSRTAGEDGSPAQLIRYQFSNHLGSAILELDDTAQIISYEEYYPYGSTSFQSVDSSREVSAKRYRYTGKERDEESGLYYHGARYYAPWLGRWISCDPARLVYTEAHETTQEQGLAGEHGSGHEHPKTVDIDEYVNLYRANKDNPIVFSDPTGNDPISKAATMAAKALAKRFFREMGEKLGRLAARRVASVALKELAEGLTEKVERHILEHTEEVAEKATHSLFKSGAEPVQPQGKVVVSARVLWVV
jgi:RHS repeat-associated protein